MQEQDLRLILEQAGESDKIDEIVAAIMEMERDDNKRPAPASGLDLQTQYEQATGWQEKAKIAARILSDSLDKL